VRVLSAETVEDLAAGAGEDARGAADYVVVAREPERAPMTVGEVAERVVAERAGDSDGDGEGDAGERPTENPEGLRPAFGFMPDYNTDGVGVGRVTEGGPAASAGIEDGDVIVDDYDALEGLMSGMDGGDDGELPHDAVATIAEVAKQARFLLAASCRCSMDECVRTLGRLQLNGFEMTASEPEEGAEEAEGGRHRPVGVGVFPSASYTNHSCAPNCAQRFDAHGCIVVETARDVRVGEELTIPYVDVRLGRRERRERLRKNFAFDCACERCAAEAD